MTQNKPEVGVATIVKTNGLIVFGHRIASHGYNTWAFPGGGLEKFESFYECSKRELYEETGFEEGEDIIYLNKNPIAITNDFFIDQDKHYITLFLEAKQISSKFPIVKERDKCGCWGYVSWDDILNGNYNPLFLPVQNLIRAGYNPFKK